MLPRLSGRRGSQCVRSVAGGPRPVRFGHRVPALSSPRVAATQASDRKPSALHRTVALEGVECVVRTAGDITTGRGPAREHALIRPHGPVKDASRGGHRRTRGRRRSIMVVRSRACDQSSSGAVTRIRRSPGGGRSSVSRSRSLSIAWIRRRIRFRTTAPPTSREIANATREIGSESGRYCNRNGPRPALTPSERRRSRERRPESPTITRPIGPDPSGDELGSRLARRGYSCGCGTRASCVACGHSAGKDASSLLPQGTTGSMSRTRHGRGSWRRRGCG